MTPPRLPIPSHWVGLWKGYGHLCTSLSEALVELAPEDLSTHALVLGATGSGKTNLLHHLIASLPNSLQSKLQRFDNLIAQGESALSQGDVELAKLLSLEARRLIAQAAPQIAALIELAHTGCRGYEMQTIETTDREQAVPKTFLGISFGSEIVNVRTTVSEARFRAMCSKANLTSGAVSGSTSIRSSPFMKTRLYPMGSLRG